MNMNYVSKRIILEKSKHKTTIDISRIEYFYLDLDPNTKGYVSICLGFIGRKGEVMVIYEDAEIAKDDYRKLSKRFLDR